jgi:hypothetical protein
MPPSFLLFRLHYPLSILLQSLLTYSRRKGLGYQELLNGLGEVWARNNSEMSLHPKSPPQVDAKPTWN